MIVVNLKCGHPRPAPFSLSSAQRKGILAVNPECRQIMAMGLKCSHPLLIPFHLNNARSRDLITFSLKHIHPRPALNCLGRTRSDITPIHPKCSKPRLPPSPSDTRSTVPHLSPLPTLSTINPECSHPHLSIPFSPSGIIRIRSGLGSLNSIMRHRSILGDKTRSHSWMSLNSIFQKLSWTT